MSEELENKKDNSRSLYLYTALIFVVALVMIIISFFGQSNLEKTNKAIQDQKSISEKSAALSEENMKLVEKNIELENKLTEKDAEIEELKSTIAQKDEKIQMHDKLAMAYSYYTVKNFEKAEQLLKEVDFEMLDGDLKVLYTQILDEIKE